MIGQVYNKISRTPPFYRRIVAYLLITAAFVYGIGELYSTQAQFSKEINTRQQQNCLLFEKANLQDVNRLRDTYKYLISLTAEQRKDPLNRFVIANLPQVEMAARASDVPKYCDDPGYGLPEPGPSIPNRPASLNLFIKAGKS